jgi:chemotaxis protein CheC
MLTIQKIFDILINKFYDRGVVGIKLEALNSTQLDFFKELENIGVGNATTALATMLGRRVEMKIPRAQFCEFGSICDVVDGPGTLVAATLISLSGEIEGYILLVIPADQAHHLAQLILGQDPDIDMDPSKWFDEMERSAISETGNILSGAYLTAISSLTGLSALTSVPDLVIDMAGAVMSVPAIAFGAFSDTVLFLETGFYESGYSFSGYFFLIPNVESYKVLMNKMGIA